MNCMFVGDDDIMVFVLIFFVIFVLLFFGIIVNVGFEGIYICFVV